MNMFTVCLNFYVFGLKYLFYADQVFTHYDLVPTPSCIYQCQIQPVGVDLSR